MWHCQWPLYCRKEAGEHALSAWVYMGIKAGHRILASAGAEAEFDGDQEDEDHRVLVVDWYSIQHKRYSFGLLHSIPIPPWTIQISSDFRSDRRRLKSCTVSAVVKGLVERWEVGGPSLHHPKDRLTDAGCKICCVRRSSLQSVIQSDCYRDGSSQNDRKTERDCGTTH